MPGVYISYPFCRQKCSFCNFASGVEPDGVREQYQRRLEKEMRSHVWQWTPETLYLGGGTPSLMTPLAFQSLMGALPQRAWNEATIECEPGSISETAPGVWLEAGINRVSLGVQSAVGSELSIVGRRYTAAIVKADVARLRGAGFQNVSVDLIAGLPGQTAASWEESLQLVDELDPPHVSVYIFEVDEESRLGFELLQGGQRYGASTVPGDDVVADLFAAAVTHLKDAGYVHYEISNFARPGFESQHNLKYWQLQPYIGFGLDAHSFDGRRRWSNPDDLVAYLGSDGHLQREPANLEEERFFIGLRLLGGIQPEPLERERFADPIAKWKNRGLLIEEDTTLRLAPEAVLVSNEILADFVHA